MLDWLNIMAMNVMIFLAQTGTPIPETTASPSPAPKIPPAGGIAHSLFHNSLLIVYFLICLGLVLAVLIQTTKNEGLSGIIGGASQSVFRGKKGFEEKLGEITKYLAVGFLVFSILVTVLTFRQH